MADGFGLTALVAQACLRRVVSDEGELRFLVSQLEYQGIATGPLKTEHRREPQGFALTGRPAIE
jgi:hypothetical protein